MNARARQQNALARARSWRGNFEMVRRAVKQAAKYYPISDIQWYNLQMKFGSMWIDGLKSLLETEKKEEARP